MARSWHCRFGLAALLVLVGWLGGCVAVNPGDDDLDPSITFTIANRTFTLTLGSVGRFSIEPGIRTSNISDVNGVLFARTPTDRPVSGEIRLRSAAVEILAPSNGKSSVAAQSVSGSAMIDVFVAAGGTDNPCETGIQVGTFTITVENGAVTSVDQSLALPPSALGVIVTNNFSLCLRIEANFTAVVTISGIDFVFGPSGGDDDNDDDDDNGNDNDDDGVEDNGNDNDDSTNDNGDDDSNTNDNDDNGNDNVPVGYTVAQIIHRGREQIVAGPNVDPALGLQTPTGYGVSDIALSGDGQRVWFVLYDEFPNVAGDPTTQLWSVNTDGTGGARSLLSTSDLRNTVLTVSTNHDGSMAIADSGFDNSAVLRAAPGQPATLLFDTLALGIGGCVRGTTRLADDGTMFLYRSFCTQSLFQSGTGTGATPLELFRADQFLDPNGTAARAIQDFDIDATGARWIADMEVLNATIGGLNFYIVPGMGGTRGTLESLPSITQDIRNVQFNHDGTQFAYCQGGPALSDLFECHVQPSGSTARTTIADGRTNLGDLVYPDHASRVYVRTSVESAGGCSYFQDLVTGERYAGGSSRLADSACAAYFNPQLSDDGAILASAVSRGVYVLHDGSDGQTGFPNIQQILYRYDGDEFLYVRVVLFPGTTVERIYVLPYYNTGLDPTATVPEDENPFFDDRSGGGVNWLTTFTPVEGTNDVYERAMRLCNGLGVCKRSFITSEYRLRIVAVDATGTRTTFQDFRPLP